MTDTPPIPDTPTRQPPRRWDTFKGLVGDLARPFSIYVTSLSAAVVPVVIVVRTSPDRLDLIAAAALVGALYAGVGALYWGKAWENAKQGGQAATVEVAKAQAPPTPTDPPADPTLYGGPRA